MSAGPLPFEPESDPSGYDLYICRCPHCQENAIGFFAKAFASCRSGARQRAFCRNCDALWQRSYSLSIVIMLALLLGFFTGSIEGGGFTLLAGTLVGIAVIPLRTVDTGWYTSPLHAVRGIFIVILALYLGAGFLVWYFSTPANRQTDWPFFHFLQALLHW